MSVSQRASLLLEIMLAIIILSIVSLGIIGLFTANTRYANKTVDYQEALTVCQSKIEELASVPFTALFSIEDSTVNFVSGKTATVSVNTQGLDWDNNGFADAAQVTVRVEWDSN